MKTCPQCQADIPDEAVFCPHCAAPQPGGPNATPATKTLSGQETIIPEQRSKPASDIEAFELSEGQRFADRFDILGKVGQGGMGVVYKATDSLTNQTVALKLLNQRMLGSDRAVERLIAEATTARTIRHENVVAVYDVGRADGQVFMSMEYVEGGSLRAWISENLAHQREVPLRVAARIIAEILDGLKVAHANNVIHRDLKPDNIILTAPPTKDAAPLKILDFGIARSPDTSVIDTGTTGALGSIDYMAPEQRTDPDTAGPSADLYSVSMILYQLLVGNLPGGFWQPPSGGRTDVPVGIDKLVETGLSQRAQSRPQSAVDYRQQLVDAVNRNWRPPDKPRTVEQPPQNHINNNNNNSSNGLPTWAIFAGIGGAALGLLLIIVALIDGSGGGGWENEEWTETGLEETIRREDTTGPRALSFSELSGVWHDGSTAFNVRVRSNGSFSGSGVSMSGETLTLSGSIPRSGVGRYTVSGPFSGRTDGTTRWDGACHVSWQFTNTFTGQVASGVFHIDHPPIDGVPCPARLN